MNGLVGWSVHCCNVDEYLLLKPLPVVYPRRNLVLSGSGLKIEHGVFCFKDGIYLRVWLECAECNATSTSLSIPSEDLPDDVSKSSEPLASKSRKGFEPEDIEIL